MNEKDNEKKHRLLFHLDHDATLNVLLNRGFGQEDEEACGEEENESDPKGNIDEVRPH